MSNLINLGLSGLNAAQWGLTTTGQNISNASTPGYTIETPVYAESGGQYTGSGYLPQGVSTVTVTRQYSQYLTTQLNDAQSSSSSLATYNSLISQLNNLIGSPTAGIASAITSYFTGMQNVSNNASSLATRQTAMSGAQTLANQINAAGQQYDALRQSVNTQLNNTVSQINSYTQQIAQLNGQINAASTQGQPPNQLLDQRDLAVSNLSQLIGVQVVNSNGAYSVFMSNGQPLVSGGNSFNLGTAPSTGDSSELSVQYLGQAGANPAAAPQDLPDSKIEGGTLGGLVAFRSQTLDPAEAQLGAIAVSFASQVNAQNALGITLAGVQGGALFSVGGPTVYANTQNTGNASLSVSFADATQPTTGDYTLAYNGSSYTLTDNSTGKVVGSASNLSQPINGLNFSTTGTMNAGDSFTVEPTRGALNSFATATTDAAAIAAASPVLGAAASTNTGTGAISSGTVTAGYTMPSSTTTLTYNGTGLTGFPVGSTVTVAGSPATTYPITSATTVVPYSSSTGATLTINNTTAGQMNNVSVTISGVPAAGDKFTIGPNTGANNDGRNALALSNLSTAKSMNGGTVTLTGAYANYVNDVGNQTNQIQTSSKAQASLVTQITTAQQSVSGVNINEEAANLLQYQQLYQANSKVIQTAQTLFQTLLGIFQ
ncbi:flagellar hook-associated protein FlgK [bacterium M00.F.Ca.ET.228.01.1.1]|uniref:flagellar hook-associated protein FlgK n=1 Tax=Paraburkholderia phenoliruptrix TaxID=252970 RepID=UPI0010928DC5|nr:flagellar hook-associated protein FlgK [Paraburkholderia phenoliruptrix]TGP45101.1 flagellar hook-associated protein FlgK [bacterium M00.F.Ca.ET.228.01.1.1]TGS02984.1 flagellar hook-associated protein FlgK [bacterium M00.F.Ca.ET.191.01.1.1]TGU06366.1 flagellar hook-associated protein FlgK [bacterium M00.F.Ca.ET.155.01.1.1]MBW0448842.1 flagellar hook-associated protein FlgK [Paraburkholderia phenoliruptrix]MBW9097819.1 flagellar hook-associated protein FlgK [Paraburkholderia phenoliruptrix]